MERTKLLTLAIIGLLLLNLLTIGYLVLKPDHPDGPPDAEGPVAVIIERLHFDTDQQVAYQTLVREHRSQVRALRDQSAQLFRDYYGLLESVQPDSLKASALSEQIAINQRELAQLNFTHFSQIKSICRPNQLASFNRLVGDLSRLFGQQRPPRPTDGGSLGGSSESLPLRP